MRKVLAENEGQRRRFRATFVRTGKKINYQGRSEDTILLNNVIDVLSGERMTDHIWFTYTKGFEEANIKEGDVVEFDARVKEYRKGYVNRSAGINNRKKDFKLSHPTKIKVVQ